MIEHYYIKQKGKGARAGVNVKDGEYPAKTDDWREKGGCQN